MSLGVYLSNTHSYTLVYKYFNVAGIIYAEISIAGSAYFAKSSYITKTTA